MAITYYSTGTISLTNGSAVVTGTGTGWQTALIVGGVIYPEAAGNPLPISSVDSNTSITAATKWVGATGTYAYAIARQDDVNQVLRNAQALSTYLTRLDNDALAALAGLDPQADRLAYFTGDATAALATITAKARELLDDASASAMLTTLGVSDYAKTLLDDANISAALSTLGVSPFIKTLLDDVDQATARTTLGAQASLGFVPIQQGGGAGQTGNKIYIGLSPYGPTMQVDGLALGRIWTDSDSGRSLGQNGYQKFPSGLIIQWGQVNSFAAYAAFPVAFPTQLCALGATILSGSAQQTEADVVHPNQQDLNGATWRPRYVTNGGGVAEASQSYKWWAIGY